MRRITMTGVMLLAVATTLPGGAYVAREQNARWAEVEFYQEPDARGAWLNITFEGKSSHGGVPPTEIGAAGGAELCFQFEDNSADTRIALTCTDEGLELTALESARAEGSMEVQLLGAQGEVLGVEEITYDVTFVGTGPLYPGASAQLDPEPAIGGSVTLLRDAIVEGGIVSPSLGSFVLTGRRARLGQSQTIQLAPLADEG